MTAPLPPATDDAARYRRARALFDDAVDLPPDERERFLQAACGGDAALLAQARALLAADDAPADVLARGPARPATPAAPAAPVTGEPSATSGRDAPGAGAPTPRLGAAALLGRRVGPWRLDAVLGRGGMATVYRGVSDDGRRAALKRLEAPLHDAEAAARFRREIRLGARLRHPHLLPVVDALADEDRQWLAMPLVEGETLRQRLAREPRLPVPDAVRIAAALADALAALHAAGIVHRDLKPGNVLLATAPVDGVDVPVDGPPAADRAQPLLTDFGIARALDAAADDRVTLTGLLAGTPAYMSPEQFLGEGVDAGADTWALGVVLHEMLAGEPPRRGAALRALLRGQPGMVPPPSATRPEVPPAVDAVVSRLIAPERARRWTDAAAARDALRALSGWPGGA